MLGQSTPENPVLGGLAVVAKHKGMAETEAHVQDLKTLLRKVIFFHEIWEEKQVLPEFLPYSQLSELV